MKRLFWLLAGVIFLGLLAAGYMGLQASWRRPPAERFRTAKVRRQTLRSVVLSTGTVQPVQSVQVGSFVSGPIKSVMVDFNSKVKKGETLAQIDPRTFIADIAGVKSTLAYKKADVTRVRALLEHARKNEQRALKLRARKKTYIAASEVDQYIAERKSLEAQLEVALASVAQTEADLERAETELEFTTIKAPVDGIVIDRKVDDGQTLASLFQTPVMFIVAPDLEKKIYIHASVDEADIGLVRSAKNRKQPVEFTVDAYPDDTFQGKIFQVRLNPLTVQNVVTYTVVVESPNPELKLLPGMTASLSFQIDKHENVLTLPNGALWFRPPPESVHPQHRSLLESASEEDEEEASSAAKVDPASDPKNKAPAGEKKDAGKNGEKDKKKGEKKHVWVIDGELLSPVEVTVGLSDGRRTEMLSGKLKEGDQVVIGLKSDSSHSGSSSD
jgi:HlyD family secretion protein